MKKEVFYLMGCKGDGCESPDTNTPEERAKFPWLCGHCNTPYDNERQIDIVIDETEKYLAMQRPYTFSYGFLIDMVWEPFIRTIPQHVLDRDMYFGGVFGSDKKRIEGWLTCRCRYNLFRRGAQETRPVTVCKDCGYVRHWSHPNKPFLYPPPPEDADIFQCDSDLLFRESVYQYLDMDQWKKKVYITKITVADKPMDGVELPWFQWPRDLKWVAEHPELERC